MSDLNIIAIHPITRRVTFSFNTVPLKVEGMSALLQLCVKTVLTTAGSDIFAPEYGGGARAYIKSGLYVSDMPRIASELSQVVRKAERDIFQNQETESAGKAIPADERLKSLTLLSVNWNEVDQRIDARILVTSVAGESADVSLANQIRIR